MDSLTQIVLGGAVAAAVAPAEHRRAALLAGAALGTLPDLDVLPLSLLFADDPVARMTWHRGPSHSLFVLPLLAFVIWAFFKRRGGRVAAAPTRWWWAIFLPLFTHPLLDAFTVYGTQLWWPLPIAPTMWSSVFIIDPLYTIWLLVACVLAWGWRERRQAQWALLLALLVSTSYLGWSQLARHRVEQVARSALAAQGMANAPLLVTPTPLNTVLWRVLVMTPEGYLEGEYAVFRDAPLVLRTHSSDVKALARLQAIPDVARLGWFNHGFQRLRTMEGRLVLTDIRMGAEPDYFFHFVVAEQDAKGRWQAVSPVEELAMPNAASRSEQIGRVWRRLVASMRGNE